MRLCARRVGSGVHTAPTGVTAARHDGDSPGGDPREANAGSRETAACGLCLGDRIGSAPDLASASRNRQTPPRQEVVHSQSWPSQGPPPTTEMVMREIVLDTETTGLDPAEGHRIVEIACVELFNHLPTGRIFHRYVNPEREVSPEALAVHGLTDAFLAAHPPFAALVDEFLAFLGGDRLVIHNAEFDLRFINAELKRLERSPLDCDCEDTLLLARRLYPGAQA